MVNIIVITHGDFGAYLIEAAEGIVGAQSKGVRVVPISARLSVGEVKTRLQGAIEALRGPSGIVVATDMPGGTPCNVAMPLVKDLEQIHMVSGVNLYMLIAAFNARKKVDSRELAGIMVLAGKRSCTDVKNLFLAKA
ncbi:MAG: PTS sugar transporter subunit IIA [Elusimicrobia bacterium]|nr:MAG: PTS sugar transporter subunit IIA [Elusimicrobiota bacterium]